MNDYTASATGLYDPRHEHDACGVGFVAQTQDDVVTATSKPTNP